tara:strand:- start:2790 stop:3395 length:606 start_codon:yes stop_codon:yes gene_type:complete
MSYNHKIIDLKYRINKLVPKTTCERLINIFEKYVSEPIYGTENSYKFKEDEIIRDNYMALQLSKVTNPTKDITWALETAKNYINIMVINYVNHIKQTKICPTFTNFAMHSTHNVRILKYQKGQFIGDHSDVDHRVRASCTLNLNEDYKGGEFKFFNGLVKEEFKTGDSIIFPGEPIWIHGTEPITEGTRYSINCFLHDGRK